MSNYNNDAVKIIANYLKTETQKFYLDSKNVLPKEAIEDEILFGILPQLALKYSVEYKEETLRALIIFLSARKPDAIYKSIFK